MTAAASGWLELAVECDNEAVEPVSELFARYGYNEGVVVEEPFTQDPDGDNMALDGSRPVTVRTFLAAADTTAATLDEIRQALWYLGRMRHVGELTITERAEEDWANAWKAHYYTHRIGERVTVRPPWHESEPEPDQVMVVLDPGMAFGTGLHPSTRLCVLALEQELRPGTRVLDVGTGSGILAIAAAKLGATAIDAVDIEPVAVRATRDNAERNEVGDRIRVELGSVGPDAPFIGAYDLVLANIIARILIDLAPGLVNAVAPGGTLVLSGIIGMREPAVRRAFDEHGLVFDRQLQIEDWIVMIYRRPVDDATTSESDDR
ncbi:MAG: 50S ribosomal protein L11 methyltransferase [Chloroflexota bacterium]|nr:50S ribosomal protein L11 methyltransferase [Chloroflexota bacterium]